MEVSSAIEILSSSERLEIIKFDTVLDWQMAALRDWCFCELVCESNAPFPSYLTDILEEHNVQVADRGSSGVGCSQLEYRSSRIQSLLK